MRLSPSKLSKFLTCPEAYNYKYVQGLEEPSGQAAVNGTFVHRVLETVYQEPPGARTLALALDRVDAAWYCWPKVTALVPDVERAYELVWNLFDLEDPTTANCRRTELDLELPWGDHSLKGIIDRVDVEEDGYVIVDYKTGKAPRDEELDEKALGVKFYAWLGQLAFGSLPVRVKLLYLGTPQAITFDVGKAMARGIELKATAAVESIERGNFKAKPGLHCRWCSFKEICPSAKKPVDKKKKKA